MHRHPRLLRTAVFTLATAVIAATFLALAPVAAASAATTSMIALYPIPASPTAGQTLTMQVFTGAIDGSYPPGEIDLTIEGTAMSIGGPANTINGEVEMTVGTFPIGTVTVDATFTPTDESMYAPVSIKRAVTIQGIDSSLRPLFPSAPVLGKPVTADAILFLPTGSTKSPGGAVGFAVGGVSVGSCTPIATDLKLNWSCSATLPAPTKAGPYTVTVTYGRSSYYTAGADSITATVAAVAPPAAPAAPKAAAAAAASDPTPGPTATATGAPSSTPTTTPRQTPSAVPLAAGVNTTDARSSASLATDPWLWLFLVAIVLLLAAAGALLLVLRRRSASGTPTV